MMKPNVRLPGADHFLTKHTTANCVFAYHDMKPKGMLQEDLQKVTADLVFAAVHLIQGGEQTAGKGIGSSCGTD